MMKRQALMITLAIMVLFVPLPYNISTNGDYTQKDSSLQYTLEAPQWELGDWWTTYRTAKDVDSNGNEVDITDSRTYTYGGKETININGTQYYCRRLEVLGNLTASGEGTTEWNGVPVRYTYTLDATIEGEIYLRDSDLGIVRYMYNISGTVHVVALNELFEEYREYWTSSDIWYDTPMSFFGFPIQLSHSYQYSGRVNAIKKTYTEGENNDQVSTENYYFDYNDGITTSASWTTITMDQGNLKGDEFSVLYTTFIDMGGYGNMQYNPPKGGTMKTYYSPKTGFLVKQTVTNRYIGENQYTISSEEVLVDYSYNSKPPEIIDANTNSSEYLNDGSSQGTCIVWVKDVDGLLDIEHVEADMTQIGLGLIYLVDDGTGCDSVAWDGNFSATFTVPSGTTPGQYTIYFKAYDMEGNVANTQWTITVVSFNTPPQIISVSITPENIPNDGYSEVLLTTEVNDEDGHDDIVNVFADLNSLALGILYLNDEGNNGDATSGDGIYSVKFTVPPTVVPAQYNIIIKAQDSAGYMDDYVTTITVVASNHPPKIVSVDLDKYKIPNDGKTKANISVSVNDADGISDIASVYIDLGAINSGKVVLEYNSLTTRYHGSFSVETTVHPGEYELYIYAEDTAGQYDHTSVIIDVIEAQYPPEIINIEVSKNEIIVGEDTSITIYAHVTDKNDDIVTVMATLNYDTGIETYLSDDGIDVDTIPGDSIYSGTLKIPEDISVGTYIITINAVDSKGLKANIETTIIVKIKENDQDTGTTNSHSDSNSGTYDQVDTTNNNNYPNGDDDTEKKNEKSDNGGNTSFPSGVFVSIIIVSLAVMIHLRNTRKV